MLFESIKKVAKVNPHSPAILTEHRIITYEEFVLEVMKLKKQLKKSGLTSQTPLAIVLEQNEVIWAIVVAASSLKIPLMLVDPNLKDTEMKKIMSMYQTCYELHPTNFSKSAKIKGEDVIKCFLGKYSLVYTGLSSSCWSEYIVAEDEQSYLVLLTSGSTKMPSGVVKTIDSIVGDGVRIGTSLGIVSSDRVFCAAPVYHAFGLICGCFATFLSGCSVSFQGAYVLPSTIENRARQLSCTVLMALPFHYRLLVEHVEKPFNNIRFALSSTAPLSKELLQSCRERLNLNIHNIYGSSEAGAISLQKSRNAEDSSDNVGQLLEGVKVKFDENNIIEENGRRVSEMLINSSSLAVGYLNVEGIDGGSFSIENGWWRTGDLAYLNGNCELIIAGRVNITINVNGKKVNPYEVESVLNNHPAITEAVVVGKFDIKRGEIPVAFVVTNKTVSEEEIFQFCNQRLSAFKIPRKIVIREVLPKTSAGKVRRRELQRISKNI
ncbi:class I adenylate-forming enzyme family protein [Priestia sp. WB3]|uniref:class I adenylate-forming enzyme family protein n=1 Tax=Bacillus pumilus TaxID=1408 RepID=UPI0011A33C10|nr:class I adenylate-forming enzyme family protein [Bacillus pumilus]